MASPRSRQLPTATWCPPPPWPPRSSLRDSVPTEWRLCMAWQGQRQARKKGRKKERKKETRWIVNVWSIIEYGVYCIEKYRSIYLCNKVLAADVSFLPGGVHDLADEQRHFPNLVSDDEHKGPVHVELGGVYECREWDQLDTCNKRESYKLLEQNVGRSYLILCCSAAAWNCEFYWLCRR